MSSDEDFSAGFTAVQPEVITPSSRAGSTDAAGCLFSCLIVNYNAGNFLSRCLISLFAHLGQNNFEVIVVDNFSSDDSIARAKRLNLEVRWFELEHNAGFARANNLATSAARGEFLVLLNPDTEITRDCITPLVQYLMGHAEVGLVGGHHQDGNGCWQRSFDLTPTIRREFDYALLPRRYWNALPTESPTKPVEVGWLYGSFLVIRRALTDEIGLFDEIFFLNDEDMDLARRVWKHNLKVVYHPVCGLIHYGGVSKRASSTAMWEYVRSRRRYYSKYYGRIAEALYCLAALLRKLRDALASFLNSSHG